MTNIFLFLGIVFMLTFMIGLILERIRVPWIFAALLIGTLLASYNPYQTSIDPKFEATLNNKSITGELITALENEGCPLLNKAQVDLIDESSWRITGEGFAYNIRKEGGALHVFSSPFSDIIYSSMFIFLAQLGMYFLLFVIGFEIDLKKLRRKSRFIVKAAFFIIFLEALFGTLVIEYLFHVGWVIAFLVALSFATVGEEFLIPILDEFRLVRTNLGRAIEGIGILNDVIELFALILLGILLGSEIEGYQTDVYMIFLSLFILFTLTVGLSKLRNEGEKFNFMKIETLFLFTLFIFFLFVGFGEYAHSMSLAALLAGIGLRTFIPHRRIHLIESEVKTMCYGFFAPIFFLWIGATLDINYLFTYPALIILILLVTKGAKLLGSYVIAKNELGVKKSILLGVALSIRFSTGIIIIKILFDNNLIDIGLYSVVIASSIVFKFIIPPLFSNLLLRWKVAKVRT